MKGGGGGVYGVLTKIYPPASDSYLEIAAGLEGSSELADVLPAG
jgi:hypothetical protein